MASSVRGGRWLHARSKHRLFCIAVARQRVSKDRGLPSCWCTASHRGVPGVPPVLHLPFPVPRGSCQHLPPGPRQPPGQRLPIDSLVGGPPPSDRLSPERC